MAYKPKPIKKILGIDFETANRHRASACSVGLYLKEFATDNILFEENILINPNTEFEMFNTLVHGISAAHVANKSDFASVGKIIADLIDDDTIVVAHNASFDMSVIVHECERYNMTLPSFDFICTYMFARSIAKNLASYSLNSLCERFDIGKFQHHNSLEDAKVTVKLFEYFMQKCDCVNINQLSHRSIVTCGHFDGTDRRVYRCHVSEKARVDIEIPENAPLKTSLDGETDNSHPLFGKNVVFTGVLLSMTRGEAQAKVESVGGIAQNGITKHTNYLVFGIQDMRALNGHEKSSKQLKAESLVAKGADLQIIGEDEFVKMLGED